MDGSLNTGVCSSCRMREVRETSSIPEDYTCGKCILLQLVADCVRELELQLVEVRKIQETESFIDRIHSELVTPKVQA